MLALTDFLKQKDTISLPKLEQSLNQKPPISESSPSVVKNKHHQDIKITSPFYKRIDQHPQNCKCIYHKRIKPPIKKIQRIATQPNQQLRNSQTLPISKEKQCIIEEQNGKTKETDNDYDKIRDFKEWMSKLTPEQLNYNYLIYLKSLPNFTKFKRHKQLDCHNLDFEKFLKSRYLANLDKKKSEKEVNRQIKPRHKRFLHRVKTQGNIDYLKYSTNGLDDHPDHMTQKWDASERQLNSKYKGKRIGFKGTQKEAFELSSQEDPGDRRQKRKKTKFFSSRPSFFGLVQDQQLLKQICLRFMQQNRRQNKQAELMIKQLVEADIDLYTRLMNDIKEDLVQGLSFGNTDQTLTNKLVKIILNKINNEVKSYAMKTKDQLINEKVLIIEDIIKEFGWNKQQKPIGIKQFWKINQSLRSYIQSRKSFDTEKRSKMSRNESGFSNKFDLNKRHKNSKGNLHESRSSQFSVERSQSRFSSMASANIFGGKSIGFKDLIEDKQFKTILQKQAKQEQYKVNSGHRNILKKGTLKKKGQRRNPSSLNQGGRMSSLMKNKSGLLVRKQTCFFKKDQINDKAMEEYIAEQNEDNEVQENHRQEQDDRSSSIFLNIKRQVLKHIQANKKFLKRVETDLKQKEIVQFVIGISSGILTKKRKIRAINEALQKQQNKQSQYYIDLLKYLQIYEEYCDIVVKKQKKKTKSEASLCKISDYQVNTKQKEEQQMQNLLYDLRKQRQLKYVDLKWLQDQEDPKEELIIKMPQFSTQIDRIFERERKNKKQQQMNKVPAPFIQIRKNQSSLVQADLQFKVKMSCQLCPGAEEGPKILNYEQQNKKYSGYNQIYKINSKLNKYIQKFKIRY